MYKFSYYPLYPAHSNGALAAGSELPAMDSELWELYAHFPQGAASADGTLRRPHILIVPSDLRFFVKVVMIILSFLCQNFESLNYTSVINYIV